MLPSNAYFLNLSYMEMSMFVTCQSFTDTEILLFEDAVLCQCTVFKCYQ